MHYHLKNLEIWTRVGVYETEKTAPQKLLVCVKFEFDARAAGRSDDLPDTIDYSAVEQLVRQVCAQKHYQLLEHLHETLKVSITKNFPALSQLEIVLEKFPFESGSILVR